MKKKNLHVLLGIFTIAITGFFTYRINNNTTETAYTLVKAEEEGEENENYSGPAQIAAQEWARTIDPALGYVPRERLVPAIKYAEHLRGIFNTNAAGFWTERGPDKDTVGVSNGNTRANSAVTAGRVRAVLVDANDASGNTVWVGGVCGGLWKNTNIAGTSPVWTAVSDVFSNMSVTSICQDPTNANTLYFATGEWCFNVDAVAGDGVWKSTDGGNTWAQLASTTGASYDYCSKILCDNAGNVYLTTRSGVFRSTNGGSAWTAITPSGLGTSRFSDMELSSTGRLFVSSGIFSTNALRYTDAPTTVTSATWTAPTTVYPSGGVRTEIACNGNTLYALPSDASYQVPIIYKSTDGGANWASTTTQPTSGWASGQAWYALAIDIDPANDNNVIIGGLEPYKTADGGATWTKVANWIGTTGQYVHADIHFIDWYSSNRVLFGCDGGIHYSSDAGTTIRDRNTGLRLKQFFSCDYHPSTTDYFLAGAQDNGSHRLRSSGLAGSTEVTGGDGAFVHVDQDEPQFQFTSYIYNQYRRSTNGGNNWTSVNLSSTAGQFINPTDYDDVANVMYCGNTAGTFRRWTNPQTGSTSASITIPELSTGSVLAVTVSPYTSNRVYFGTDGGRVVAVDNANTIASGSAGTNISTGLPAASVSCIAVGSDDNNLMATYSNYGVNQVNVSTDGGVTWTNIDGNLPDMPVRWCIFYPGSNTKAIIATEAGIWITELINGASTSWYVSPNFPLVRTDMIKYRSSDGLLVAATHGRGLWTQSAATVLPANQFVLSGSLNENQASVNWYYEMASAHTEFEVQVSTNGQQFTKVASVAYNGTKQYRFQHIAPASKVYYRIRAIEHGEISRYSNTIKLDRSRVFNSIDLLTPAPNPVFDAFTLQYSAQEKGKAIFDIVDVSHRIVLSRTENITQTGNFATQWNISSLRPGTYTVVMRMNGLQAAQKLVKR